ncbi:MAG: transcriptional regulator, TetR family [Caulobacteraceae bacterium]|nr:transcriptional regulator, TetR family [Caulobacteraceae bacterium]
MNDVTAKRTYNLGRRAETAEATGQRILDSFASRMGQNWFEDIRLEDVAADAGVTAQTILRRFGSKDGLLEATCERMGHEVRSRRASPPGDLATVVHGVVADYEASGDLILRMLSQEDRHPAVKRMTNIGRASHRAWLAQACAPWLDPARPERLDALVVATDVYVWKLIRRDMGRSVAALEALMRRLVASALDLSPNPPPS